MNMQGEEYETPVVTKKKVTVNISTSSASCTWGMEQRRDPGIQQSS